MKKENEKLCEVVTIGSILNGKITIAYSSQIEKEIIMSSRFLFVDEDKSDKVISVMENLGQPAIAIWEPSKDDVYRLTVEFNVTPEYQFQVNRMMPNGSERRIDFSIVF